MLCQRKIIVQPTRNWLNEKEGKRYCLFVCMSVWVRACVRARACMYVWQQSIVICLVLYLDRISWCSDGVLYLNIFQKRVEPDLRTKGRTVDNPKDIVPFDYSKFGKEMFNGKFLYNNMFEIIFSFELNGIVKVL